VSRGPNRSTESPQSTSWGTRNKQTATATSTDSSAEHRRKLEALFGGTSSPAAPSGRPLSAPTPAREPVFSSPRKSTGRAPTEYRLRLERLRAARDVNEIREAADAFLSHHQLPDEPDILYRLLQHPGDKVVREALGQVSSLLMQGRITNTTILESHLQTLAGRVDDPGTRSYIDGVRAQVNKLKK
jgi:hypothetical protein